MSDNWQEARASWRRLKRSWDELGQFDDAQSEFVWHVVGLVMMAAAIISQFGWLGLQFCIGLAIWRTNRP